MQDKNTAAKTKRPPQVQLSERELITQERTEKIELLLHLLTHTAHPLVLCGPKNIGKTTCLLFIDKHLRGSRTLARVNCERLNFLDLIKRIGAAVTGARSAPKYSVEQLTAYCQHNELILLLDDAGELQAGVVNQLINLLPQAPGLKLVMAMTHDQFQLKNLTDPALDDCKIVELPPLNQKQCGEYLQSLALKPKINLSLKTLNDAFVNDLYGESHGLPGVIFYEVSKFASTRKRKQLQGKLKLVGGIAVAASLLFALLQQPVPQGPAKTIPIAKIDTNANEGARRQIAIPLQQLNKPAEAPAAAPSLATPAPPSAAPSVDANARAVPANAAPPAAEPPHAAPPKIVTPADAPSWIAEQPQNYYTLQVMVLGDKTAAQRFLRKYNNLPQPLTYFSVSKNLLTKFVVIYGSFSSLADARIQKSQMPNEFKNALERRFKFVQDEIRASEANAGEPN